MKTEKINGLEYALLNGMARRFLRQYCPENDTVTSIDEISLIDVVFCLYKRTSDEIGAIRNSIVRYYSEQIKESTDESKKLSYMKSMQSATGVCDYFRYKVVNSNKTNN